MTTQPRMDWRLLALMFALVAAAFIVRVLLNASTIPLVADTDDAMRLVVVRDFMSGQAWYDNVQHRLNTPNGAELHWSRLADLPLAGLILLFRPFLGAGADMAAAWVLPLIWLFVLLYLSGRLTIALVGREGLLPGLALPAFSLSVLAEFAPGRIDHHSLQVLLALFIAWCSVEALRRPRFAVGAGIGAATAIAIGVEALPTVSAALLAFGLMWVTTPERASTLRIFGVSFAIGTVAHLMLALPPERWLSPACDAISFTYAVAAIAAGVVFVLLSVLTVGSMWLRLGLGIVAGVVVLGALALLFPTCLGGPYAAVDPWLQSNWLALINEAFPLWQSFANDPVYPLAVAVPPILAILAIVARVVRGPADGRGGWLVYAAFLALAVATMFLQIRASRLATPLAVPAGAWLIVAARHWYLETKALPRIAGLLGAWIGSAGLAVGVIASLVVAAIPSLATAVADTELKSRRACLMPAAFAELAAIPPARVMTPIDLGSHMLAFTPHEVVAAPYHRNEAGVRDAFDFFNGPIAAGRDILEKRGVSLVVVCPAMPELRGRADAAPDSFVRLRQAGTLPDWLVEQSISGSPLEVYAVMPERQ